jgi:hypothetical protein
MDIKCPETSVAVGNMGAGVHFVVPTRAPSGIYNDTKIDVCGTNHF